MKRITLGPITVTYGTAGSVRAGFAISAPVVLTASSTTSETVERLIEASTKQVTVVEETGEVVTEEYNSTQLEQPEVETSTKGGGTAETGTQVQSQASGAPGASTQAQAGHKVLEIREFDLSMCESKGYATTRDVNRLVFIDVYCKSDGYGALWVEVAGREGIFVTAYVYDVKLEVDKKSGKIRVYKLDSRSTIRVPVDYDVFLNEYVLGGKEPYAKSIVNAFSVVYTNWYRFAQYICGEYAYCETPKYVGACLSMYFDMTSPGMYMKGKPPTSSAEVDSVLSNPDVTLTGVCSILWFDSKIQAVPLVLIEGKADVVTEVRAWISALKTGDGSRLLNAYRVEFEGLKPLCHGTSVQQVPVKPRVRIIVDKSGYSRVVTKLSEVLEKLGISNASQLATKILDAIASGSKLRVEKSLKDKLCNVGDTTVFRPVVKELLKSFYVELYIDKDSAEKIVAPYLVQRDAKTACIVGGVLDGLNEGACRYDGNGVYCRENVGAPRFFSYYDRYGGMTSMIDCRGCPAGWFLAEAICATLETEEQSSRQQKQQEQSQQGGGGGGSGQSGQGSVKTWGSSGSRASHTGSSRSRCPGVEYRRVECDYEHPKRFEYRPPDLVYGVVECKEWLVCEGSGRRILWKKFVKAYEATVLLGRCEWREECILVSRSTSDGVVKETYRCSKVCTYKGTPVATVQTYYKTVTKRIGGGSGSQGQQQGGSTGGGVTTPGGGSQSGSTGGNIITPRQSRQGGSSGGGVVVPKPPVPSQQGTVAYGSTATSTLHLPSYA